jgi:hypothetical protein
MAGESCYGADFPKGTVNASLLLRDKVTPGEQVHFSPGAPSVERTAATANVAPQGETMFSGMIPSDSRYPVMRGSTRLEFMEEWYDMYRTRLICGVIALTLWGLGLLTLTTFPIGAVVMIGVGTKYFVDSRIYNNYFTTFSDFRVVVV